MLAFALTIARVERFERDQKVGRWGVDGLSGLLQTQLVTLDPNGCQTVRKRRG